MKQAKKKQAVPENYDETMTEMGAADEVTEDVMSSDELPDMSGLLAKRDELLGEVKKLKARLKDYDDLDPKAAREAIKELEAAQKASQEWQQRYENDHQSWKNDLEAERLRSHDFLREHEVSQALQKIGVAAPYMQAVKAMFKDKIRIDHDDHGYVISCGEKDLDDALQEWAESEEAQYFLAAPLASGGKAKGASHSSSSLRGGKAPANRRGHMNAREKSDYIRRYGYQTYLNLPE